jgi:hypothetical protein
LISLQLANLQVRNRWPGKPFCTLSLSLQICTNRHAQYFV